MRRILLLLMVCILIGCIPSSTKQSMEYNYYIPLFFYDEPKLGVQDQCKGCYYPYYAPRSLIYIPFRLDEYEAGQINLDKIKSIAQTYHLILGIRTFPEWSRLYPEIQCSPPNPIYFEPLAQEILSIVEYINPKGISIANEPNSGMTGYPFIGCLYTAQQYAEMVNYFYVRIKQEKPDIEILAGELAGCPSEFVDDLFYYIEDNYDAITYHDYAYYGGSTNPIGNCAVLLKSKLLPNKKLYLTETALLYDGECSNPGFQEAQINHFKYIESLVYMNVVDRAYWYTIDKNGPWRNAALTCCGLATPVYLYYMAVLGIP